MEIDVDGSWAEAVAMNDGNERQQIEPARKRVPKEDERGSRYAILLISDDELALVVV